MPAQLTKRLLESALEGELTDHPGFDKHDSAGKNGGNSRNGSRSKTVLTDVGPVKIDVARDRDGSFEPRIVAKRQRPTSTAPRHPDRRSQRSSTRRSGEPSEIDTRVLALKDVTAVGILSASPGLDAAIQAYAERLVTPGPWSPPP